MSAAGWLTGEERIDRLEAAMDRLEAAVARIIAKAITEGRREATDADLAFLAEQGIDIDGGGR